jgi:hypothetical protein
MKKIMYIWPIIALIFATSCEEKIPTWTGEDRINFRTDIATDTLQAYSFVFEPNEVTQYTMYIEVNTEGFVRDFPRAVNIRQVLTGNNDAIAGTHYVAFGTPHVNIPAGAHSVMLPITLLRHTSLTGTQRILRVELLENEHFLLSANINKLHRSILFSDMLSIPRKWIENGTLSGVSSSGVVWGDFGPYGPVKHRFMIDVTGMNFDDEWFATHYGMLTFAGGINWGWRPHDAAYITFLRNLLQQRLIERNEREGNELQEINGEAISFVQPPTL